MSRRSLSRRSLLTGAGAAGASVALGGSLAARSGSSPPPLPPQPFLGAHQPGIATPQQTRLSLAAFDLRGATADDLRELLARWSAAAERMQAGLPPQPGSLGSHLRPLDSGEVEGLPPAGLTVTVGMGPSLFDDRFGLADRRPAGLAAVPALPGDDLDPAAGDGDLVVQACADDAAVALHAVRHLAQLAERVATIRWLSSGFLPARTTPPQTPRNLFGMKDGTVNPHPGAPDFDGVVWAQPGDGPAWMDGGSYLVVRRVRMHLQAWDAATLDEQHAVIGRTRSSGAPLSGGDEHTPVDLEARAADGSPLVPLDAHVRLASPQENGGARMLRRGYSYDDGVDADGTFDAGILFLAYARDPQRQVVPVLSRLADADALRSFTTHRASAVFAVPPGAQPGGYVGQGLLDA